MHPIDIVLPGEPPVVQPAHKNAVMTTATSAGVRAMACLPSVTLPKPSSTAIGTLRVQILFKESGGQGRSAAGVWLDREPGEGLQRQRTAMAEVRRITEEFELFASRSAAFWA